MVIILVTLVQFFCLYRSQWGGGSKYFGMILILHLKKKQLNYVQGQHLTKKQNTFYCKKKKNGTITFLGLSLHILHLPKKKTSSETSTNNKETDISIYKNKDKKTAIHCIGDHMQLSPTFIALKCANWFKTNGDTCINNKHFQISFNMYNVLAIKFL